MYSHKRLAAGFACVSLLSGCAGMHLHSPEDAKLAAQAKNAYAKIDALSLIATVRSNLEKLRDAEIARAQENLEYIRDLTLYDLLAAIAEREATPKDKRPKKIKGSNDGKQLLVDAMSLSGTAACKQKSVPFQGQCYVQQRAASLGFMDREKLIETVGKFETTGLGLQWQREIADVLSKLTGWRVPECPKLPTQIPDDVLQKTSAARRDAAINRFDALKKACADNEGNVLAALGATAGSEVDDVAKKIAAAKKALQTIETEKTGINTRVKELEQELDALAKAQGPDADKRRTALVIKARDLRKLIANTGDAAAKIGMLKGLADAQLEKLDVLLAATVGEEIPAAKLNDDANLRKATLIAQSFPGLAAEIGAAVDAMKAPAKPSLLIAKGQALVDKQNAADREALVNRRLTLYRAHLRALIKEAKLLKEADDLAGQFRKCTGATCEQYSLRAYAALSQSVVPARVEAETALRQDLHLDAEAIMAANEYALRSWDNLVRTPLDVLQSFHEGGIKPSEMADLIIKAGGVGVLGIIAGRVH